MFVVFLLVFCFCLFEALQFEDEQMVVSAMYYKPDSNEILCFVRELARDGKSFYSLDEVFVTVDYDQHNMFVIEDISQYGTKYDFSRQVAAYRAGYELELVEG